MRKKHTKRPSPFDDPGLIPREYWNHVVKIEGNDVWFLIDGRIIIAKDVSVWSEDLEREFPKAKE